VLGVLREKQLYAKLSKCEFWMSEVQFLGHVISTQGIAVDPTNVEAMVKWESPKSATKIRSFVGVSRLLQEIHRGILQDNGTPDTAYSEAPTLHLDGQM